MTRGLSTYHRCIGEKTIDGIIQRELAKISSKDKNAVQLQRGKVVTEVKKRLGERVRSYTLTLARRQQHLQQTSEGVLGAFLLVGSTMRFPPYIRKGINERVVSNVIPYIQGLEDCMGKTIPASFYQNMAEDFYGWIKAANPSDPSGLAYEFHGDGALYVDVSGMKPLNDYKWVVS